jgi:hypothetical protein
MTCTEFSREPLRPLPAVGLDPRGSPLTLPRHFVGLLPSLRVVRSTAACLPDPIRVAMQRSIAIVCSLGAH